MTPEQKQQEREKILRLALEYISADPENHDAQSIVKDHIDTAKKALRHASSIPDENWSEEDERRMYVIPQNGNDGEHYSELEEYIVIQNGIDSGPFTKSKAHEVAKKWAETTPGKPAAVCHVLAVYQSKVEVERVK